MSFNVGDVVYVNYGEVPVLHHTRVVLAVVDETVYDYVILTPDLDVYVEKLHDSNPDFTSIHPAGANGAVPAAIAGQNVYGFRPLTAAEFARFTQEGREEAVAERNRRGLRVHGAGADDSIWVLAEMVEGKQIGDQVVPPPGCPQLDGYGLMVIEGPSGVFRPRLIRHLPSSELGACCDERIVLARASVSKEGEELSASDDLRTMEVHYLQNGERRRAFKDAVGSMTQVEMEGFPFEPRTCLEYLNAVTSLSESAYAQHLAWVQQARIPEGSRAIFEDEVLAQMLDVAVSFDCLNVANLASFELLVRRRQLIADAHSLNPSAPSYDGADYYLGSRYKHGGGIIVPALTEHVSKRLQADSQILKERRRLEEAKGRGRGRANPPRGRGRGGGGDQQQ